jgi:hypothetical protein
MPKTPVKKTAAGKKRGGARKSNLKAKEPAKRTKVASAKAPGSQGTEAVLLPFDTAVDLLRRFHETGQSAALHAKVFMKTATVAVDRKTFEAIREVAPELNVQGFDTLGPGGWIHQGGPKPGRKYD